MDMVTLGSTGITVNKNGFGALPIQRISQEDAVAWLRAECGIVELVQVNVIGAQIGE